MPKADARWHYVHKRGRIIYPWYPPAATVRRAGPAPRQSRTIELPMLVQVWVDNPEIESMGGLSHYPSVMWWHRWGRAAVLHSQPFPFPSMTGAGGRAGPVVIRVGKPYLTPSAATLHRTGTVPCRGRTAELTLLAQGWANILKLWTWKGGTISHLSCRDMGMGNKPSPCPATSGPGGRADHRVIIVRELFLTPTSFSILERKPCMSTVQHNGANPVSSVWMRQAQRCENGRAAYFYLSYGITGGRTKSFPHPTMPWADGRAGLVVITVGDEMF